MRRFFGAFGFWVLGVLMAIIAPAKGQSRPDTSTLLQTIAQAQQLEANQPEAAKALYRQVKQQSEAQGWKLGVLKFYTNYTAVLNQQGRYDSSLMLNLEAVKLAEQYGDEHYKIATTINAGLSYLYLGDAQTAVEYYYKALPLAERGADKTRLAILYDNLGNAFDALKNYEAAKAQYARALEMYAALGDTTGLCYTYNNLSKALTASGKYDSARLILNKGIALNERLGSRYLAMIYALNQANLYLHTGAYAQMEQPALTAFNLANELDDAAAKANACYGVAWHKLFTRQVQAAHTYALMGLAAAKASGSKKEQSEILELLGHIALWNNDLNAFNQYYKQSAVLADSILNQNIQQQATAAAVKHETALRNNKIAALEAQSVMNRRWNLLLAALLLLLMVSGWLVWRNYHQRHKLITKDFQLQQSRLEELEKEKQLLASQALLRGQEEERSRLAKDLHDGLGGMLSGIKLQLSAMKGNLILSEENARLFGNALDKLDNTMQEMRRVAHSMMPESLIRLGLLQAIADFAEGINQAGSLQVKVQHYGIKERLPQNVEVALYRITQELLTNILKHAQATQALIQLSATDGLLSLTVEDNGIGFDVESLHVQAGAGISNIRSRVSYLNGQMDIRSTARKGTSVLIEIPNA